MKSQLLQSQVLQRRNWSEQIIINEINLALWDNREAAELTMILHHG